MSTWAVIKTGGKQYIISPQDVISVEKIGDSKEVVTFNEVLLVGDDKDLKIGKPYVEKAKVRAKIIGRFKDKKVRVVKFKSKSRYLRTTGHRQQKTKLLIEKIES